MRKSRDRSHDKKYYGWQHQKLRRSLLVTAVGRACVRCGKPIEQGQEVELDHVDGGRWNEYRGLSHKVCNRRAGGILRQALARDPEPKGLTKW